MRVAMMFLTLFLLNLALSISEAKSQEGSEQTNSIRIEFFEVANKYCYKYVQHVMPDSAKKLCQVIANYDQSVWLQARVIKPSLSDNQELERISIKYCPQLENTKNTGLKNYCRDLLSVTKTRNQGVS